MELNSNALPTLTEKIYKNVKQKKLGLNSGRLGEIMKRYGAEDQGSIPEVEEDQQEAMDSYLKSAKVVRSRYEEDIFINDHLAVWGSWYNKYLGWGYACCFSTDKLSYCSGSKGKEKAISKEYKIRTEQAKQLQKLKDL